MSIRDFNRYRVFAEKYYEIGTETYKNIYRSAIAAGYKENYARTRGVKLLETVGIKNELARKRNEIETGQQKGYIADTQEILKTLTLGIRFRPQNLFDEENRLRSVTELPPEEAYMLKSIKIKQTFDKDGDVATRDTEYQFPDKKGYIVELAKLLGLTNGNKETMDELLRSMGIVNITVNNQTNNYNSLTVSDTLKKAIEPERE